MGYVVFSGGILFNARRNAYPAPPLVDDERVGCRFSFCIHVLALPFSGNFHETRTQPMFTGLVQTMGTVAAVMDQPPGRRLSVRAGVVAQDAAIGDSICINGCCLTVVAIDGEVLDFEAGEETLSRTNLGRLVEGSRVNLERSLAVGDPLGGHYVTGHVDALGRLIERRDDPPWAHLRFQLPRQLASQVAAKGSIAVDGVSLTVVDVDNESFSVALIPHTLNVTTLGERTEGDEVNLETDVLAKYVQRCLQSTSGTTI